MRIRLGAHLYSLIRLYMLDKVLRRMRRENTHDYINFMVKVVSILHQPTFQSATTSATTAGTDTARVGTAARTIAQPELLLGELLPVMEELLPSLHTDLLQEFQSGSLDFGENVAERGHQPSTTDVALELLASRRRGKGSTNDVLLAQDTLDDAGGSTNGLKEARVRRDDEELGSNSRLIRVIDREVELEREVAHQRWGLTRL